MIAAVYFGFDDGTYTVDVTHPAIESLVYEWSGKLVAKRRHKFLDLHLEVQNESGTSYWFSDFDAPTWRCGRIAPHGRSPNLREIALIVSLILWLVLSILPHVRRREKPLRLNC